MMNDDDDSMLPHVDAPLDNSSVPGTRYHVNYTASAHFPETYEPVARRKKKTFPVLQALLRKHRPGYQATRYVCTAVRTKPSTIS